MRGKKMEKNARHAMRQPKAFKPKPTPANDPSLPDLEKKHLITKPSRLLFYDTYFPTPESASERGKKLVIPHKSSSNAPSLCFPSIIKLLRAKSRHEKKTFSLTKNTLPPTSLFFPKKVEGTSLFPP